jgi:hypothetical protein
VLEVSVIHPRLLVLLVLVLEALIDLPLSSFGRMK